MVGDLVRDYGIEFLQNTTQDYGILHIRIRLASFEIPSCVILCFVVYIYPDRIVKFYRICIAFINVGGKFFAVYGIDMSWVCLVGLDSILIPI